MTFGKEQSGSWWQQFTVLLRRASRSSLGEKLSADLQARVNIELVEFRAAQATALKTDNIARLLAAIERHGEAIVMVDTMIIIRHDGKPIIKTVSAAIADTLNRHPEVMTSPQSLLEFLGTLSAADLHNPPTGEKAALP